MSTRKSELTRQAARLFAEKGYHGTSIGDLAEAKGWRWVGEMEEIADTFDAAGLPGGFHRAAAEVYRGR